jgi:hypothetical protein
MNPRRTELDVTATTVAKLLDAGVLGRNPETIQRAALAVGVGVRDIRDAWARCRNAVAWPTPSVRPIADPPAPVQPPPPPAPEPEPERVPEPPVERQREPTSGSWDSTTATAASRKTKAWAGANPEPGKRRCARCKDVKPVDEFPIKNQATGTRRSYCTPCWLLNQRERYLSVERVGQLDAVGLTFTLSAVDEVGGLRCKKCGGALFDGQEVRSHPTLLEHVVCPRPEATFR